MACADTQTLALRRSGPLPEHPRTKARAWTVLLLWVLGLMLFMFVLGPRGLETETLKPMADFIEERQIRANAYYYTEVPEFSVAETSIRDSMRFTPTGP